MSIDKLNKSSYLLVLLFHLAVGLAVYFVRPLGFVYFGVALIYFLWNYVTRKDKTYVILQATLYFTLLEIFLRMTKSFVFYETGKYIVIAFMTLGIVTSSFKVKASWFLLIFLLFCPAILITSAELGLEESFRKNILFNFSGPLSLIVAGIYCYDRKVLLKDLLAIIDVAVLPVIPILVYIILYTPSGPELVYTTESNSSLAGGFGPNQVSTVLGLAAFLLYVRFLLPPRSRLIHLIQIAILALCVYRGILTFSRGGMITFAVLALAFTVLYFFKYPYRGKQRAFYKLVPFLTGGFIIWVALVVQTGGMIQNRYEGRNVLGEQEDITTGRGEIVSTDLLAFYNNPIFGIGVGMGKYLRGDIMDVEAAAHNEVSRVLGEHGLLGIIALLLIMLMPFFHFLKNPGNLFVIPFALFWFLTINHSAMRLAAPGMIYGLSLLNVVYREDEDVIDSDSLSI